MDESKADVLLHPVRMRIVQALSSGERCTVQQMGRLCGDIPQATLYRHLNKLVAEGFIQVVEERPVGGTTERVYSLAEGAGSLGPEDFAGASKEDHMRYFTTFCVTLLGQFGRYLDQERFDLQADGVGYRSVALYLSDQEFMDLVHALNEVVVHSLRNKPAPGRRRRHFSTIVVPDPEQTNEEA